MFRPVIPLRRLLAAAAALLAIAAVVPAVASSGEAPAQPAPKFVSPYEPLPGTGQNITVVGHIAPPGLSGTEPAGQYSALGLAGHCAYIGRRNFNSTGQANNGLGVQI